MLYSYHSIFRFNQVENEILADYADYYSHSYRKAYAIIAQQNNNVFQLNLKALELNEISNQELVKLYKEKPFKLPEIYTKLSSHKQKYLAQQLELTGRQMNSISKQLTGNLKSLLALAQLNLEQKQNKLIELNELLSKEKEKLDNLLVSTQYKHNPTKLKQLSQQYSFYQTHLTQRKNKQSSTNKSNINFTKKKYVKYEFENQTIEKLVKAKHKVVTLTRQIEQLNNSINKLILNKILGKLPLCFGSKKLFHKQFNLEHYYKGYTKEKHEFYFNKWKKEYQLTRNHALYLMGCFNETAGNQTVQSTINSNGNIDIKLRLPDKLVNSIHQQKVKQVKDKQTAEQEINNLNHDNKSENKTNEIKEEKYLVLNNLNFGYSHDKLVKALKNNLNDESAQLIHYRFERNIDKKSSKYHSWIITFQIEDLGNPIITDKLNGSIGIDLNQEHLAISEIDAKGNLIKSFNIPFKLSYIDTYYLNEKSINHKENLHHNKIGKLSSHQTEHLLANLMVELCDYAKEVKKPIVIENLDFKYKKEQLSLEKLANKHSELNKKRNKQLSSFVYSKFASLLKSRSHKEGVEIIEINPAYTSLLGLIKYQKEKGLSTHQAAAYVIARKGLNLKEKIKSITIEQDKELKETYENEIKSYCQSHNKKKLSDLELRSIKEEVYSCFSKEILVKGHVLKLILPVRKKLIHEKDMSLYKSLSKELKEIKSILKDKLIGKSLYKQHHKDEISENTISE